MSYNLKCDPGQSPACGEWDYTTHTKIWEHTGVYDSTLYYHPNYMVNNQSPDSFMMMTTPSYYYIPTLEYINPTTATNTAEPGTGTDLINIPFNTSSPDGRMQFIYLASELQNSGLQTGEITGINFNFVSGNSILKHFKIRIGHTEASILPENTFISDELQSVYNRNTEINSNNTNISFSFPFDWNGTSNLIFDISYADFTGSVSLTADIAGPNECISSSEPNNFLDFEGWDFIEVPKEVFSTIDSAITISFWQYGNPDIQPINSSIFEGVDSIGRRVLNAHLPWSNGKIYWDAGFDGNDRIFRQASATEYMGQWNFWTFIKDTRSGSMQILLNGNLWFIGNGRVIPMNNIDKFRIGAGLTYDGYYAGMIDDFRIWDTVISWKQN